MTPLLVLSLHRLPTNQTAMPMPSEYGHHGHEYERSREWAATPNRLPPGHRQQAAQGRSTKFGGVLVPGRHTRTLCRRKLSCSSEGIACAEVCTCTLLGSSVSTCGTGGHPAVLTIVRMQSLDVIHAREDVQCLQTWTYLSDPEMQAPYPMLIQSKACWHM